MKTKALPHALPVNAREAAGFDAAQSSGLFVGVRSFDDPQISEVPFAVDDAVDLASLFAFDLELVPPDRIALALAGEPQKPETRDALAALREAGTPLHTPTPATIYRLAWELGQESGEGGLYVLAFATHGYSDQGRGVLVAADTLHRRVVHTGVDVEALLDDIARASAPRRLVLLDACRGRLSAATRGDAEPTESVD